MIHKQRQLTSADWDLYDQIVAPMKALTEGFRPNELCAKPFVSSQLITPSVMIVGYNPGKKGTNSTLWYDPHTPSAYTWANEEFLAPKDKFLQLFHKCFMSEDWKDLVQQTPIDIVWTNLYPFHTRDKMNLDYVLDEIAKKDIDSIRHPRATCREVIARLIVQLIRPKMVLCAGKEIHRELTNGLKAIGYTNTNPTLQFSLAKGVTYSQIGGIHVVGFNRMQSAGFYFDHLQKHTHQQDCLRKLTNFVLNT